MFILILSLIFALFIAIFALQNASQVPVHFFWFSRDVPLVLIILGSAFLGALIMFLLALWREIRIKHKRNQENHSVQTEISTDAESTNTESEPKV